MDRDTPGETHTLRERRRARTMRDLLVALALSSSALPGVWASTLPSRGSDPLVLLVWLGLIGPSVGALAAGLNLRGWPEGAAVIGVWTVALVTLGGISERILPTPLWTACALAGLFYVGFAVGRLSGFPSIAATVLALATLVATWLPGAAGSLGTPWPAGLASTLLDLSPSTLLAECAGVDWMRVDGVYPTVGTDRFSRAAWTPELAGPVCLLLGCVTWGFAAWMSRRRRSDSGPELDRWR